MVVSCYIENCKLNSRKEKGLSLFKIPTNYETQKKWMKFANVSNVSNTFRLCRKHFEDKYIMKYHPRMLLVRGAVPTLFPPPTQDSLTFDEGIHFPKEDFFQSNLEMYTNNSITGHDDNENGSLNRNISKQHRRKASVPAKLKNDADKATINSIIKNSEKYLTKEQHLLFSGQLQSISNRKSGELYSKEIKDIALSIYSYSPETYECMKKIFNLPPERVLQRYQAELSTNSDLNESFILGT